MAVYTPVAPELLADFLTRYDVGGLLSAKGIAEGVENTNYLVDTTGGRFVLTLYEKRVAADDLPFFLALLDHLANRGLPVPPAIRDRNGMAIQQLADRPACLIQFLPGVSVTKPTTAQAFAAGKALADLHVAARDFPLRRSNTMGVDTWADLHRRCGPSLDRIEPGLHDWLGARIAAVVAAWPRDLPAGTIHADLFPDNVLMRGDEVGGLIDFYFACTDLNAYDLAVMHTAWSFDPAGVADWAIGSALIAGYESVAPLSVAERDGLGLLAVGACLRFTLSRAWDWLNTPADALVTRKDPLAYVRRIHAYHDRRAPLA